jgi:hypothetical protein
LVTQLRKYCQAWQQRRDNPLLRYFSLAERRSRMRLPWYRRNLLWVIALGLATAATGVMVWDMVQSNSAVGPQPYGAYQSGVWELLQSAASCVAFIWLAFSVFDAVRNALVMFSLPGPRDNRQRVDELVVLGQLRAEECVIAGAALFVPRLARVALLLVAVAVIGNVSFAMSSYRFQYLTYSQTGQPIHASVLTTIVHKVRDLPPEPSFEALMAYLGFHEPLLHTLLLLPVTISIGIAHALLLPAILVLICLGAGAGLRTGIGTYVTPMAAAVGQIVLLMYPGIDFLAGFGQLEAGKMVSASAGGIVLSIVVVGALLSIGLKAPPFRRAIVPLLVAIPFGLAAGSILLAMSGSLWGGLITGEGSANYAGIVLQDALRWIPLGKLYPSGIFEQYWMGEGPVYSSMLIRQLAQIPQELALLALAGWFAHRAIAQRLGR